MGVHKDARTTPHSRVLIDRRVAAGETPAAADRSAPFCIPHRDGVWPADRPGPANHRAWASATTTGRAMDDMGIGRAHASP